LVRNADYEIMHGHTYIHTYIHTHIHTYIHTHIHTYIHTYNTAAEIPSTYEASVTLPRHTQTQTHTAMLMLN
jgi:hypothetical protein